MNNKLTTGGSQAHEAEEKGTDTWKHGSTLTVTENSIAGNLATLQHVGSVLAPESNTESGNPQTARTKTTSTAAETARPNGGLTASTHDPKVGGSDTARLQQVWIEQSCRFNCDAESACVCAAHKLYRALRTVQQERDDLQTKLTEAFDSEVWRCHHEHDLEVTVASLRADVARLTGELEDARRQLGVVQNSCRISERCAATAEQQVLAIREGIEQLLVSVEATHDVTQWFAQIAKLSALLAAIKET